MTLNKGIRLAAVLVGVGSTMGAFAQIYNFRSDFSITNGNPNGAWTYGWQTGLGGAFTAYADSLDNGSHTLWYTTGMSGDNTPSAFLNHSGGTINGVLDGEAGLHGGYYGEMSVARFDGRERRHGERLWSLWSRRQRRGRSARRPQRVQPALDVRHLCGAGFRFRLRRQRGRYDRLRGRDLRRLPLRLNSSGCHHRSRSGTGIAESVRSRAWSGDPPSPSPSPIRLPWAIPGPSVGSRGPCPVGRAGADDAGCALHRLPRLPNYLCSLTITDHTSCNAST